MYNKKFMFSWQQFYLQCEKIIWTLFQVRCVGNNVLNPNRAFAYVYSCISTSLFEMLGNCQRYVQTKCSIKTSNLIQISLRSQVGIKFDVTYNGGYIGWTLVEFE